MKLEHDPLETTDTWNANGHSAVSLAIVFRHYVELLSVTCGYDPLMSLITVLTVIEVP